MSVVIRLSRTGKKGERKFRIVVKEKRSRRDGQAIETLGWYTKGIEGVNDLNKKRLEYWISKGAKPSLNIIKILNL